MEVKVFVNRIDITLVDVWYKENYWTSSLKLGNGDIKTGPFNYNKGHRKATLWDGAGTILMELYDLDFPPYHIKEVVSGRAFYWIKNKLLSYGQHSWWHRSEESVN